jgi:hypothetical protein
MIQVCNQFIIKCVSVHKTFFSDRNYVYMNSIILHKILEKIISFQTTYSLEK